MTTTVLRPAHECLLSEFAKHGNMTPDELAEKIGRTVLYTRPRCSELRAMGYLYPTGEKRPNSSGIDAGVLARSIPAARD